MKRRDLNPGQWYVSQSDGHTYMATQAMSDDGCFTDPSFRDGTHRASWRQRAEIIVTPCDPPAWFGYTWQDKEQVTKALQEIFKLIGVNNARWLREEISRKVIARMDELEKEGE